MEPWLIWLILALAFFVLEMFAADFIVASVGVGCLVAGAVSLFGVSLEGQFIAFIVGTLALMLGVRPRIKAWLHRSADPRSTGTAALIGRTATIVDAVGNRNSPGRVKLGSEEWQAFTDDGRILDPSEVVTVKAVEAATLHVTSKNPHNKE
jgi:membrane protein implicated in regulation of membrane protease activity